MRLMQERGKVVATGMGGLQIIETLKATGSEDDFFSRWAGYHAKLVNSEQQLGFFNQSVSVLPTFLSSLSTAIILGLGGFRVIEGALTVGSLVAFQTLMSSFNQPITKLVEVSGRFQEITGDLARLNDVLRYRRDPRLEESTAATPLRQRQLAGRIDLHDVSYGYSRLDPPLIEGFDLHVEPGARVALVGGSGSGKSTLARLIAGLYRPWKGEIAIDGISLDGIPNDLLANSLASVDQDIFLFNGTVRDNLTLWDDEVSTETLTQATKDACIYDVIAARPGSFDSMVESGGSNFSGGQAQRLEIARALVNDPSMLILDEATSALDPTTEMLIDSNLRRRGCTCIIVAHRLSTIRDCDEIIVLDRGKVVERGTHDSLLQADGTYARLIAAS
jgi:ABC-type bacteriocin/lantibiotic exporter with double-glycine peptidase domain